MVSDTDSVSLLIDDCILVLIVGMNLWALISEIALGLVSELDYLILDGEMILLLPLIFFTSPISLV